MQAAKREMQKMYGLFKAATDNRLKPIDKSIIMLFFKMCGTNGYCWPAYKKIARDLGITRRYAIMRVKYLEQLGYIIKAKGTRRDSNVQSSNKYFINNNPE